MSLNNPFSNGYLGSKIDDVTGQQKQSNNENGTRDTFDLDRFTTFFGNNLSAGEWRTLAVYTVEPQTEYNTGYGSAPVDETVGRFFANFSDGSGNSVIGMLRIKSTNSHDENADTEVSSIATQRLNTNANDKRQQYAQPEVTNTPKVGPDSKIKLQFKLNASSSGTSIAKGSSTGLFDMTRFD